MPGQADLVQLTNLYRRLADVKEAREPLLQSLNWLKSLHSERSSEYSRLIQHIRQRQTEIDVALSNNRTSDYQRKVVALDEIKWERDRCLSECEGLARKVERAKENLRASDQTIFELEGRVNALRSGLGLAGLPQLNANGLNGNGG